MCFKQEDNHLGCSQHGSGFNVRLQSAARRITTRKDRRQAGDDEVQRSHWWLRGSPRADPTVAVCLLPGTEVAFETEVKCEHVFKVSRSQKLIGQKVARFRQINMEEQNVHHDALEFPDGQIVLLTRLCEGQHATVLQLPASLPATNVVDEENRNSIVAYSGGQRGRSEALALMAFPLGPDDCA